MRLPDATAIVVAFLDTRLPVPVSSVVPTDRDALASPARFITVRRTGGPAQNRVVDKPTLLIHAWGTSSADAATLCQDVRSLLLDTIARDHPLVRGIAEVVGPYYTPDPESKQDRFGFSISLTTRAKA